MTLRRIAPAGALLLAFVLAACVLPIKTTTALTASATSVTQGKPVTFTARVAASPVGATPSGTVRFQDGAATVGTVRTTAGVARLTTSSLAPGRHTIETTFVGASGSAWAQSTRTLTITVLPLRYHLALGDSLAAGVGAPTGQGYVPRITAAEATRVPRLTLQNLSCSGATTGSMLAGGGCTYPQGNQVAAAEAFLKAHRGAISFITIDIGANDVTGCVGSSGVDPACASSRILTAKTNLAQILDRLHVAAPGVPVIGMTYYNPFLAFWVMGNEAGATSSTAGAVTFNSALTSTYTDHGALVAPVASAFDTENAALTGSYNATTVPQNVANVCAWTHMCERGDIHANATGHQLLATTFATVINGVVPAG